MAPCIATIVNSDTNHSITPDHAAVAFAVIVTYMLMFFSLSSPKRVFSLCVCVYVRRFRRLGVGSSGFVRGGGVLSGMLVLDIWGSRRFFEKAAPPACRSCRALYGTAKYRH